MENSKNNNNSSFKQEYGKKPSHKNGIGNKEKPVNKENEGGKKK